MQGANGDELIERLQHLSHKTVLRDFALFHGIVRMPKPTYLKGLNRQATLFLQRRVAEVAPQIGRKLPKILLELLAESIRFCNVTVTFFSHVRRTRRTHAVQQAFDISPDTIKSTTGLVGNLEWVCWFMANSRYRSLNSGSFYCKPVFSLKFAIELCACNAMSWDDLVILIRVPAFQLYGVCKRIGTE